MVRYNIPFWGARQPSCDSSVVPLVGAVGSSWGPLSRQRKHWPAALAGTALVHLLGVVPALVLISNVVPPTPPAEPAVEMVFAEPAMPRPELASAPPKQPSPAPPQEPPTIQPVEAAPPPPSEASPPPVRPTPQVPAVSPKPPIPAPASAPSPPEPQMASAPAEELEPLPLPPPPAPPPPPRQRPATARRVVASPPVRAPAVSAPASASAAAAPVPEPSPPARPAVFVSSAWKQALAAWLAEHKAYPEEARRRGIEGSVTLHFSVDRSGRVTEVAVTARVRLADIGCGRRGDAAQCNAAAAAANDAGPNHDLRPGSLCASQLNELVLSQKVRLRKSVGSGGSL